MSDWPWFAFRRRFYKRRGVRWHDVPTHALDALRARLRAEGPLTTTELGGAKRSGEWWDWSEAKVGIEWLLDVGEVVCVRRVGWRRVYDLAERAVPARHSSPEATWVDTDGVPGPDDDSCLLELLLRSVRVCGVGTAGDVADVHRLGSVSEPRARLERLLADLVDDGRVARVRVQGWKRPAYADPAALAARLYLAPAAPGLVGRAGRPGPAAAPRLGQDPRETSAARAGKPPAAQQAPAQAQRGL